MKTTAKILVAILTLAGLAGVNLAQAQAPASVSGVTFFNKATDAAAPFDYPNYGLVFVANSGNTFLSGGLMDGSVDKPGSGIYEYAPSGADGLLSMSNHIGSFTGDYNFSDANTGNYTLNQSSSGGYQDGTFTMFTGPQPSSLAGMTFYATVIDSQSGYSGSYTVVFTSKTATRTNNSGTRKVNYTYSAINQGSGKINYSTSKGSVTAFAMFTDPMDGVFASYESSGYWEVSTFTAIDEAPPAVNITAPKTKSSGTNSSLTVSGTAADNVAVSNVLVAVNGGAWNPANLANNNTAWSEQVTLVPGANTIAACAVDTSGNVSAVKTITVTYLDYEPMTVLVNGNGSVKPNYNGQLLQVGKSYSMKATPASGNVFVNWTGTATVTTPTLKFMMAPGMNFTANFAPKP